MDTEKLDLSLMLSALKEITPKELLEIAFKHPNLKEIGYDGLDFEKQDGGSYCIPVTLYKMVGLEHEYVLCKSGDDVGLIHDGYQWYGYIFDLFVFSAWRAAGSSAWRAAGSSAWRAAGSSAWRAAGSSASNPNLRFIHPMISRNEARFKDLENHQRLFTFSDDWRTHLPPSLFELVANDLVKRLEDKQFSLTWRENIVNQEGMRYIRDVIDHVISKKEMPSFPVSNQSSRSKLQNIGILHILRHLNITFN